MTSDARVLPTCSILHIAGWVEVTGLFGAAFLMPDDPSDKFRNFYLSGSGINETAVARPARGPDYPAAGRRDD